MFNFKKIKRKWIIIGAIIILIVGYFSIKPFFKNDSDGYVTENVAKGLVLQEVTETGSIKATEDINLGFKTTGKISRVMVSVGQNVAAGQAVAELDKSQLAIQLKNAEAALVVANAQYQKVINGYTPEDIKTYQDAVDAAKQDLEDSLDSALNTIQDGHTKIYNALTTVTSIQNSYFGASDQEGVKVQESRGNISVAESDSKTYLDKAEQSQSSGDIDTALTKIIKDLNDTFDALKVVRDTCDSGIYYSKVSSTDKSTLDTQKGYINTALSSAATAKADISSYKIALQKAEDNLRLRQAPARKEDVDLYKAQIDQAQAQVDLLRQQIQENVIYSPINGRITKVNYKRGEVVSAGNAVVSLLSINAYQIKVDVYEQDIVNVKEGNSVKVNLVAFSKDTFFGKVVSIDPAEKIVDDVVYYETTIDFTGSPEGVRPGMTADIVIETNKKEDVLRVPANAVEKIDSQEKVQIINKKGKVEDRVVEIGLEGNDYVEILSGLVEGEQVVIGKK